MELEVAFKKMRTTTLLFLLADMAECAMKEEERGGKPYTCELPREAVENELRRTMTHLNGNAIVLEEGNGNAKT